MTAARRLRVAYHDADPAPLLRAGVRPLLAELAAEGLPAYWARHWRRGPHLRIVVDADDAAWEGIVRPAARRHLEAALAAHPSTTVIDPATLRETYRLLAEREREYGPLEPQQPDNTVEEEPHDPRLHVLGTHDAVALFEGFHQRTSDAALTMAVGEGPSLSTHVVDLMLIMAQEVGGYLERGFVSYRSHAEAHIMGSPDPRAVRALFDERSARLRDPLVQRVRAHAEGATAHLDELTVSVGRELVRAADDARPLLADGRLDLDGPIANGGGAEGGDATEEQTRHSDFHRTLRGSGDFERTLREAPWFLRYRVALNLLYLHLARIGVRPVDRFLYCHVVADAVEQACGVDAVAMVASGATELVEGHS
ncbi:thiopeptide maturation pyridine synthase [Nocardiopsis sp. L17-MgMaSL7]|uniref:thiopeptide maturation pyridine synthase n=1 Tax=Nocardiopsis sp. L17-MgMaSL7 TaxID=1938893 RepID=UPI000D709E7B|nr:thiopeptide maturation pyridine synthase [Nocardiopsis sp. L17-MgMaSL7]PWV52811.1 lantibiotic biosynthesis dehydratase-like protein [Nocardiopsis sp. L17-MgMaSL7]